MTKAPAMTTLKAINDLHRHCAPLRAEIEAAFAAVLDRGHFILGPEVDAFEQEFAAACGTAHGIAVANGTDALELALKACGVGPGDVVVTVANAGLYSTTAIRLVGGVPAYADVDPATGLVNVVDLAAVCARFRPRALVATHLYGRMVDMPAVLEIARAHGCRTIEDCAQAHLATLHDRPAGSWGDLGCFSFYPTKNLGAIGDAGAVVTSAPPLAAALRELRQYGWSAKYDATRPSGRNSRMDELQAAVLRRFLPLLGGWNDRRRAIAQAYGERIRHPAVRSLAGSGCSYVAHLSVFRCRDRDALRGHLRGLGIPTDVHYPIPDHRQQAIPADWLALGLTETERLAAEVVTLPCFPEMTAAEVETVIAGVNTWRY